MNKDTRTYLLKRSSKEKMNIRNFERVLDIIKKDPDNWNQHTWHCGTKHCLAGWAQVLKNHWSKDADNWHLVVDTESTVVDANEFLRVKENFLYTSDRKMEDFEFVLAHQKMLQRKRTKKTEVFVDRTIAQREEEHVQLTR